MADVASDCLLVHSDAEAPCTANEGNDGSSSSGACCGVGSGHRKQVWAILANGALLALALVAAVHSGFVHGVWPRGQHPHGLLWSPQKWPVIGVDSVSKGHGGAAMEASVSKVACFVENRAFYPIGNHGSGPLHANTAAECQTHCAGIPACEHFSFDFSNKQCHLQDRSAVLWEVPMAFVSGPSHCP